MGDESNNPNPDELGIKDADSARTSLNKTPLKTISTLSPTVESERPRPTDNPRDFPRISAAVNAREVGIPQMTEAAAFQVLSGGDDVTTQDRINAAMLFPGVATRLGWYPEDIELLRQEVEATKSSEVVGLEASLNRELTPEQIKQQEVYGKLYGDLLTTFRNTPAISRNELLSLLGVQIKAQRLAGPQLGRALGMINRFCLNRQNVQNARSQFSDDSELFKHVLGFAPQQEVKVIDATTGIAFYTPSIDDREQAFGKGQRGARSAAGFVTFNTENKALAGSVIILEYRNLPDILDHEKQHVTNNKIIEMKKQKDATNPLKDASQRIKNGESPQLAIASYLDAVRTTNLKSAADEIIAFFAGGTSPDQMKAALTQSNTTYGTRYRGLNSGLENYVIAELGEENRSFLREKGNTYLGEEYDQIIISCVDAFQQMREAGLTQDQATGYLATLHPEDWLTFVNSRNAKTFI